MQQKPTENKSVASTVEGDSNGYPYLERANTPDLLRQMPQSDLPAVCADIRRFLINSLSVNPGHFASSMGVVELTVALHYVFNTPYDRIVWDVGHQAYGHKLLTGRRERFDTNRRLGGLSGFPNPSESEYDTFMAGHASNSISAALGMAVATVMNREDPLRNVVAVIGDASISGGLAFEGLNNAANIPNNLLIVLNDNDMSIDDNVGSLHGYLAKFTTTKHYNNLRYKAYNLLKRMKLVSEKGKGSILRFNNSLKSLISGQQNIFEGLNIRYFGPIDGHDIDELIRVLTEIKDMKGPRMLHIKTVKGKGFNAAEKDPTTWHAPGKFDPLTGERPKSGAVLPPKYQDVFGDTLLELAQGNPKIVGITAAMASGTSVSTMQKELPHRVFDVGISEGHAVTFSGGLAKDGLHPVCAIYSSFLQRGYDHLIHDVAIQHLPVTFCIDRAGLVGEDGVTHHGLYDLAYLRSVPGMVVASPADEMQLRRLMYTASLYDGPFAIRYPRGSGNNLDWRCTLEEIPVGKGRRLADGSDVAVISIGPIAKEVADAIALVPDISVAHYDMTFLKPIDEDLLREAAEKDVPIITVEDATIVGGLGSAVLEWLADNGYHREVRRIGVPDRFVAQGTVKELYRQCGMDAESIADAIHQMVETKALAK